MSPGGGPVALVDSGHVFVHVLFARGPVRVGFTWRRAFLGPSLGQKTESLGASGVKMGAAEAGVTPDRDSRPVEGLVLAQLTFLETESAEGGCDQFRGTVFSVFGAP